MASIALTSETHATKTFHPWPHLPRDIKLIILDFWMHMSKPITHRTHPIYTNRLLLSLLTSHEWKDRATKEYYSNGIILERGPGSYTQESRRRDLSSNSYTLRYPKAVVANHVRKLELRLTIPDHLRLPVQDPVFSTLEYRKECNRPPFDLNELSLLVRYSLGSFYDHLSEWQTEFSNIETVTVVVTVKEVYGENRKTRSGRCLKTLIHVRIKHLAESRKIPLRPKTVSVIVKGFACD
jgi:hypothetical protein